MIIRLRTVFFICLGILVLWFLYVERGILRPFVLAAIFAYIFNPTVNFFSEKVRLPRTVSIIIIYLFLISIFVGAGVLIAQAISAEWSEIRSYINDLLFTANAQIGSLPIWLKPTVFDLLRSFERFKFFSAASIAPFFPQAISQIINFIIFVFSAYYFLKDGGSGINKLLNFTPKEYRVDVDILLKKINMVLSTYLRGQLFLVFIMSIVTFIALTILGVRFSLFLGIFSGFAEIVPVIGPIIAGAVAVLVVLLTGKANFGLLPFNAAIIVIIIYFVLRHLEDYFVIPHVMGKITKLPPFIIFFAVIAGGHLWGILGLILAVPIAAILRIIFVYLFDQMNGKKTFKKYS